MSVSPRIYDFISENYQLIATILSEYNKAHPCQSLGKGGVVLQKFVQDWIKKNPDKYNYLIMVNESDGESIDSIVSSSSD